MKVPVTKAEAGWCKCSKSKLLKTVPDRPLNKYFQREEEAQNAGRENVRCWWIFGLCFSVTGLRHCLSLQLPLNYLLASFIGQKPSPQKYQLINADLCHKTEKRFLSDALVRGDQLPLGFLFAQPFTQRSLDDGTEVY